eukprot:scaffold231272_cov22-Tisochrysis_lutea.AAC.1
MTAQCIVEVPGLKAVEASQHQHVGLQIKEQGRAIIFYTTLQGASETCFTAQTCTLNEFNKPGLIIRTYHVRATQLRCQKLHAHFVHYVHVHKLVPTRQTIESKFDTRRAYSMFNDTSNLPEPL